MIDKKSQSGYTLSELAIVLVLIGTLTALLVAAADATLPAWQVREAAVSLSSTVRAARATAIIERSEAGVPFDLPRRQYTLVVSQAETEDGEGSDEVRQVVTLPSGVRFAAPEEDMPVITLSTPISNESAAVFNSRGLLQSTQVPGYVYLGNPTRGVYSRLRVGLMGNVKVESWDGVKWN